MTTQTETRAVRLRDEYAEALDYIRLAVENLEDLAGTAEASLHQILCCAQALDLQPADMATIEAAGTLIETALGNLWRVIAAEIARRTPNGAN